MVALLHAGVTAAALAGEDGDLDRIPEPVDLPPALPAGLPTGLRPGLPAPSPAPPGPPAAPLVTVGAPLRRAPRVRFYLEDALTLGIRREPVVPFPPPPPDRWQT